MVQRGHGCGKALYWFNWHSWLSQSVQQVFRMVHCYRPRLPAWKSLRTIHDVTTSAAETPSLNKTQSVAVNASIFQTQKRRKNNKIVGNLT